MTDTTSPDPPRLLDVWRKTGLLEEVSVTDSGWFQRQADIARKSIEERPEYLKPRGEDK